MAALAGGGPPRLYTHPGTCSIAAAILERCPELHEPFVPTPWAPNGHAQSMMGGARGWAGHRGSVAGYTGLFY